MGSKLLDAPMRLLMPSSFDNIKEISFKTIPHATKGEIKTVLESLYSFEVEKVRTLNMQGKKKRRGGARLVSRPNYKKAYVTLKKPISIFSDLHLFKSMQDKTRTATSESLSGNFKQMSLK